MPERNPAVSSWIPAFAGMTTRIGPLLATGRSFSLRTVTPWSSARAHLEGQDDILVRVHPMLDEIGDWEGCLALGVDEKEAALMRRHERTGRPLGSEGFIDKLEKQLRRILGQKKRGPKRPWKHN